MDGRAEKRRRRDKCSWRRRGPDRHPLHLHRPIVTIAFEVPASAPHNYNFFGIGVATASHSHSSGARLCHAQHAAR